MSTIFQAIYPRSPSISAHCAVGDSLVTLQRQRCADRWSGISRGVQLYSDCAWQNQVPDAQYKNGFGYPSFPWWLTILTLLRVPRVKGSAVYCSTKSLKDIRELLKMAASSIPSGLPAAYITLEPETALFFSGLAQASWDGLATLTGCGGKRAPCELCGSEWKVKTMAHCPIGHYLCQGCLGTYASTQLAEGKVRFVCVSMEECGRELDHKQLVRCLGPMQAAQLAKLMQQKELLAAKLECLERCPSCDWACIMEISVEEESVFRCGNKENGCGVATCRRCKKKDHSPHRCQLDARLLVEEAMSKALVRNCPKCSKAFIKEQGCNKMKCPSCKTLSCYVCRKVITGYQHFAQQDAHGRLRPGQRGKCPLFDVEDLEELHRREVAEAQRRAAAQYGQNSNIARRAGPLSQATTTGMEQVADEALEAADRLMSSIFGSVGLGPGQNLDAAVRNIQIASQDLGRVTRISGPGRVTYTHNGWSINIINQGTGQILVNGATC
ncbi:hypothetical protein NMY22_g14821 [Coprinellus aureogranulatus]|nr:hypothetical protein NMY22_g14821 [Coprinellus aureogranulatus]